MEGAYLEVLAEASDRCGDLQDTLDRIPTIVCADHHLISGRRAAVPGWVEPRAESTCTLAYRVIQELAAAGAPGGRSQNCSRAPG